MSADLNLNLEQYSLHELYQLFQLNPTNALTDEGLKQAKQFTARIHPDKSGLDPKYYHFFKGAYGRLRYMKEFQNNSNRPTDIKSTIASRSDVGITKEQRQMLSTAVGEAGGNFNQWFNEQYTQHAPKDNAAARGYGDWLGSNDQMATDIPSSGSRVDIDRYFSTRKKEMQSVVVHKGIEDICAGSLGGSMLDSEQVENYSSGSKLCGGSGGVMYTDLKQAYTENIIPVTQESSGIMMGRTIAQAQSTRGQQLLTPMDNVEAQRVLNARKGQSEEMNASLAYRYAQEAEQITKANSKFWGGLSRLTYK